MKGWDSVFANDPTDDYNLILEIEYDEESVGYIKKSEQGLELVIFPSLDNMRVPLDWLSEIILKARNEL